MTRTPIILAGGVLSIIAALTAILLLSVGDEEDGASVGPPTQPAATPATTPTLPPETSPAPSQPRHVHVHIDVGEPHARRTYEAAQALAAEMGALLVTSSTADNTGITVSRPAGDGPAEVPVVERWVAVASLWSRAERAELSPSMASPLLLPVESQTTLEALLGDVATGPSVRWLPEAEIPDALAADVTAVAILALESALAQSGLSSLSIGSAGPAWWGADDVPWLEQRLTIRWADDDLHEFARRLGERLDVPAPPLTTVVLTGDIIPARCVYERQRALGDYTAAFAYVKEYLSSADITAGSLDASISDAGTAYGCEPTFNLLAPSRSVEGLIAAGFDVLTVATNHARDCGMPDFGCANDALLDTLANLRDAGIEPVGGGADLAEAHRPAIIERDGVRFAFLGYDDVASSYLGATETTPGTAALEEETLRADIAAALEQADVVIVLPQWGVEYTPTPTDRQLRLGRIAIEAGATLVAGNHPHVVQGVEAVEGGFIAYALGNFVFDQDWSTETLQGAVLEVTFVGPRLLSVYLKPTSIVNMFQPTFADERESAQILERMRASSEALSRR